VGEYDHGEEETEGNKRMKEGRCKVKGKCM
jgi:hypothetical protein